MKKLISKVLVFLMVVSLVPVLPTTVSTYASTMIPIDEAHFPDKVFREVLSNRYDNDGDGILNSTELSTESIEIEFYDITDLTGIKYFKNLKVLYLFSTGLKSLPELPASLEYLDVGGGGFGGELTSLPKLPNGLQVLNCSKNKLTSLPELPNSLIVLGCAYNELTRLPNLPPNLAELNVTGNDNLTSIPKLPSSLERLSISETNVKNVPDLPNGLIHFQCVYTPVTKLPILPSSLEEMLASATNISGIVDLSQAHSLKDVNLSGGYITGVKLSPTAPYERIILTGNMMNSTADITGRSDIPWDVEGKPFVFAEQKTSCQHNWHYDRTTKRATCTEEGAKEYFCTKCGVTKTVSIPREDHSFTSYNVTDKAGFGKEGELQATCTVCQHLVTKNIAAVVAPAISAQTFNNKNKTPKVTVVDAEGNPVAAKVTFANKTRKAVGKYKVTVKLTGEDYSGSKTVTFKINPKAVSISKVTAAKKAFTVKWKKPSSTYRKQMAGYQIKYSTSPKMSNYKTVTVKSKTATTKTIKKLKAKKTYYVQLRTYKTVKGVKYCSSWSKAKKIKTK